MLFADHISTSRSTGYSPFELLYGTRPVLPVDVGEETWVISDWSKVKTRNDLLEARLRQIIRMDEDVELALHRMAESRKKGMLYHDKINAHRLRDSLPIGSTVLYQNVLKEASHGRKLEDRWFGPFRVRERLTKGSYLLEEMDGTKMRSPYPARRLRRYYPRGRIEEEEAPEEKPEPPEPSIWDFLAPDSASGALSEGDNDYSSNQDLGQSAHSSASSSSNSGGDITEPESITSNYATSESSYDL
jgi:hypothetical protein